MSPTLLCKHSYSIRENEMHFTFLKDAINSAGYIISKTHLLSVTWLVAWVKCLSLKPIRTNSKQ